ncbi:MAG: nuclear transport factor 2 family protein [Dehalococcoidia bacterium]
MTAVEDTLADLYRAFNARDIDAVLACLHPRVAWPNGWEGGVLHGIEAVQDYWTRQWRAIDPTVEPLVFAVAADGRTVVRVHQVVRDLDGTVRSDSTIEHVYTVEDGLVTRMEIRPAS